MSRGDGIFRWYWGEGSAPEEWRGGYPFKREAEAHAKGHRPHGDFLIIEADRLAIVPAIFSGREVLTELSCSTANADCWPNGMPAVNGREMVDLADKLADCLDRWLRKNNFDATTAIHSIRVKEYHEEQRGLFAHG